MCTIREDETMSSFSLRGKAVLVTGSTGFIGRSLVGELTKRGAYVFGVPHDLVTNKRLDLSCPGQCRQAFNLVGDLDLVVHCAGVNGGIGWNVAHQFEAYAQNTLMALNVIGQAAERKIPKVVSLIASCAYRPGHQLKEQDYLLGEPDPTVEGHAWAKRNALVASRLASLSSSSASETRCVCLCPTTVYGPGMSTGEDAKLMGAIIGKVVAAKQKGEKKVSLWGTGGPFREFIHVRDCARLIADAAEKYDNTAMPLNLGTGQEVAVWRLATMVKEAAGWEGGEFEWDEGRPDGAPCKNLSLSRMIKYLGPQEFVPLEDGIKECVLWLTQK